MIGTYDIFVGLERVNECGRDIVHCEDNLSDTSLSECLDLMAEDGLVSEEDEGLGYTESERTQTGAIATDKD